MAFWKQHLVLNGNINDMFCKCNGKRKNYPLAGWRIIRHEYTPKHYSRIKCLRCGCVWITRAKYVEQPPNEDGQKRLF